ncbi:MAG TPA: site-2 protease family protein, partial [Candidatus Latescibacteria bacterium]|nr:site-2 protease family protein [Candidatus Latescibacterota bacterium]
MDIRFKRGNGGEGIFLEAYEIEPVRQKPSIPRVQALLLVATVFTTMVAGAMQAGVNPFSDPLQIYRGIPFSATLLTILGVHEMGHYFTSRKWGVRATLPYFIPAPSFIGTFGAIIRLKSQIPNRKALVEIGAAGPISGFILAVLASIIGLGLSPVVKTSELAGGISLGGSILFSF